MPEKYKFDPESLQYKKQSKGRHFLIKYAGTFFIGIVIGIIFLIISAYIITTPSIRKMRRENLQAKQDIEELIKKYESIEKVMKDLEKRDENIYRAVLESNPVKDDENSSASDVKMIIEMLQNNDVRKVANYIEEQMDTILNKVKMCNNSYSTFNAVLENKAKMLPNIPSIQPVDNKGIKVMIYGFGKRVDPFYKTIKSHRGLDFSMPAGSRVFATAGGKVTRAGHFRQIGNSIEIDHGYGFTTEYNHLDKILVRKGSKVERGDYIGTVGNSGKSISTHLHYEVHINGVAVNPVNFFFADISPAEYQKLILMSSRGGVSLD